MNLKQMKTEIVEDLRYQLLHKPRKSRWHNWTSEAWYFGRIYGTSRKVTVRAIEELIAEGKIKRSWHHGPDGIGFPGFLGCP
jgi:hypothetical protein